MKKTYLTSIAVAACLLLTAASQALAQAPAGGQGRGGMNFLNLTDDQRTKMREAMTSLQPEMQKYNEKLAAAQKDALKVALAKNVDEKELRTKMEAVQKIQNDMALARLKALKDVTGSLTDDQKKQIEDRPAGAYMMFLGGGFGGGMMGGGAGRRGAGGGGGGGGN